MRQSVKLTPLTAEEQAFAEENHRILVSFLNANRLDHGEFYDVAAMGFLQAVKKWFARTELQQYSFTTVAWQSMRCRIGNERRKQACRVHTVSLEETVPGTDGRTYMEMITYRHQQFMKGEPSMGLKVNFDVPVPAAAKAAKNRHHISVEIETLANFRTSTHKTLCFEYDTEEEAKKKQATIRRYKSTGKHTDYEVYRLADKIYIEKVKVGRK